MSENKIKVSASTTSKAVRVNVSAPTSQGAVTLSPDASAYNANISRQWAISDKMVLQEDYSSKYYASKAKESATNATNTYASIQDTYQDFQEESNNAFNKLNVSKAEVLGEIDIAKTNAVSSVNTTKTSAITEINNTKTTAVNAINTSKNQALNDIEKESSSIINFKEEVSAELENKVDLDDMVEINIGLTLGLFDTILKDHILTYEESQGLALQGTYVYKQALAGSRYGYPDFYNKCIQEYNQTTTTETVNGVTVRVHSNGHKFYNISDKTAIDGFFNTMGSAWFYGIDTANERIFLPRDKYFAITGVAPVVGNGMSLGLSSSGTMSNGYLMQHTNTNSAASNEYGGLNFRTNDTGAPIPAGTATGAGSYVGEDQYSSVGVTTDPVYSGIEAHLEANKDKYLYICVGNTTNYEGISDVVNQGMEILEQINEGFVPKDSMEEVYCIVESYVNGASGYNIWSNGYCEEWGSFTSNSTTSQVINLLKKYKDTNYSIIVTQTSVGSATAQYYGSGKVMSKATDSFTFACGQTEKPVFDWRTCGYIA